MQLDLLVSDEHLPPSRVDDELAVAQLVSFLAAAIGRGAPQNALDPGDELAWIERLRQVVVGTDLETDDLVHVLVTSGQHQDRHVGALAHAAADLDAVHVGQIEVEDDQRRRLRRECVQRCAPGRGCLDAVPGVLEIERHEGGDRGLVLDDEDRLGLAHRRILTHGADGAASGAPNESRRGSSGICCGSLSPTA